MCNSFPPEAEIIINGKTLTYGESMTVRVALCSYLNDLKTNGLGDDEHGKQMCQGYISAIHRILDSVFLNM